MYRLLCSAICIACAPLVVAEGVSEQRDILVAPVFQFQQFNFGNEREFTGSGESPVYIDRQHNASGRISQYNATLSYPVNTESMEIGLGVNIRFVEGSIRGQSELDKLSNNYNINTAFPMFYASASIDMPLDGMKASVSGSHMEYDQLRAYDYRAILSYTFENGLGLQGGWQHQQLNLHGGQDLKAQFENKGPFLDFFLRF